MDSFKRTDLTTYLDQLASSSPVPGGGGTAAYTAALGAALGEMTANLSVGHQKDRAQQEELAELLKNLAASRDQLLDLTDRDAKGFLPLAEAMRLPKTTEEEKTLRKAEMEEGLQMAAEVPLQILKETVRVIELLEEVLQKAAASSVSDAGCAAALAEAALKSAALNILINTKYMKDRSRAKRLNTKTYGLLETYTKRAQKIYQNVYERLIVQ